MFLRSLLSLAAAAALFTGAAAGQEPGAPETFKPFRYKSVDGGTVGLANVRGKATLVVFFFPTCQYCNVALPHIQKLQDTYKGAGLAAVWINVLPEQDKMIPKWRTQHGYTAPILLGGRAVQRDYGLEMTPTHCLLDSEGRVLARKDGYRPGDEQELEQHIRSALGVGQ